MNHERILTAMDTEIDAARRTLDQLVAARQQYAAAHGITGRRSVALDGSSPAGSLQTVALRVMADGAWWHAQDVTAAILAERTTTRSTVNAVLHRGAVDGGPFERGQRRGTYRVRPEVVARWSGIEMVDAA
jgi:hypothetical protein